jgi:hypothetical protein
MCCDNPGFGVILLRHGLAQKNLHAGTPDIFAAAMPVLAIIKRPQLAWALSPNAQ